MSIDFEKAHKLLSIIREALSHGTQMKWLVDSAAGELSQMAPKQEAPATPPAPDRPKEVDDYIKNKPSLERKI